jgi:hypothetical protein
MISSENSDACLEHVRKIVGATILREKSLIDIGFVKHFLAVLRSLGVAIPSDEEFLELQTTTIGPMLYIPDGLPAERRLFVGIHGLEHASQFHKGEYEDKVGIREGLAMAFLYFTQGQARVRLEQRANRAAWEVLHIGLGVRLPTTEEACSFLETGYVLSENDRKLSKELAAQWLTEVKYNIADTTAGRAGIEFLKSAGIATC